MIKMIQLLKEITAIPQKPKDLQRRFQSLEAAIAASPAGTDPKIGHKTLRDGIQVMAKNAKVTLIFLLRKNERAYDESMIMMLNGRRGLAALFMIWCKKFRDERKEDNYRRLDNFLTTLDETHALLIRAINNITQPEEMGFINAKKDIEYMNELYTKMVSQIDDLFQEYIPAGKFSTDIRKLRVDK